MFLPDFETRYYFTEINKGEGVYLPEPWNFRDLFQDYLGSLCQHTNLSLWLFDLPGKGAGFRWVCLQQTLSWETKPLACVLDLLTQLKVTCFLSFFKIILFIYLFSGCAGSSLRCGLFSSCSEWGLLFLAVRGLLITVAFLVVEHGLQGTQASVVVVCGLNSWAPGYSLNSGSTKASFWTRG